MGSTSTILVLALLALAVVAIGVVFRKHTAVGASNPRSDRATKLMHSGSKARALITAVQPTGMVVNNFNIQCIVHFRLEPLDGAAPFDAQKKMLISQTAMPEVGELWPSWFDPADPLEFAVGQPTAITPDQVGLFRDFGIPHPLDR